MMGEVTGDEKLSRWAGLSGARSDRDRECPICCAGERESGTDIRSNIWSLRAMMKRRGRC